MLIFNKLKDKVRYYIIPLARIVPFSPNTITFIGLIISLLAALMFGLGELILAGLLIVLSGFFDVLDGAAARINKKMTNFGAFLDSICDRYADAIVFVGIIYGTLSGNILGGEPFLGIQLWFWCLLALIGSYIVSYSRSRAEASGAIDMNIGIAERSERMIILAIGAITGLITIAVILIVLITHITILQRIVHAKKYLD
ncbi:CDP-alcohol phosphatidyltransferase family protein [Methanosalsum natronophilum]|uniref:Archaetidylinositol phosphate synthase n=1 Tax=Methanosalsum natronophilum TaxID=768733 RepID=A0A3R7XIR9_9EURY|nr:CDP-alcohol phosphatidyltransferase family protein [Methanosalsum natronophilum]MCS3923086.1 archaetidylinositol phosphate synthase [Methanosalsum natronophilum]RQD89028.1 MAG: CDP-alcohol phosphatidyltransferase family protein [Methanosalsum natronophilum]